MRRFAVIPALCVLAFCVALKAQDKTNNTPLVGTWNCTAHGGENGDVAFTLTFAETENGLTGSVSAPQGDADITSVSFKDNQLKAEIKTDDNDYALTATYADGKLTAGEWFRDGEKQGSWEGKK
ncbi:MAG: hypothetical protein EPN47_07430 [Acidobacteria bacterium]|nr:MAG: hypothetical protein EPN47_07430 [Acidobacteriota bacterium]